MFLTGAPAQFQGLSGRIQKSIQEYMEPGSEVVVRLADDPTLDAWRGMARFSQSDDFNEYAITRADYDEWGPERIKRWWGGNLV